MKLIIKSISDDPYCVEWEPTIYSTIPFLLTYFTARDVSIFLVSCACFNECWTIQTNV